MPKTQNRNNSKQSFLGVKEIQHFNFILHSYTLFGFLKSIATFTHTHTYTNRRRKEQHNRYSLGKGKVEKPLAAAWPRKEFHGKTSDEKFSVVCGGVCPLSHPLSCPHSLHCSRMD